MTNGRNNWDVSYVYIKFLEKVLNGHKNISSVNRTNDILFTVQRISQNDSLQVLCLDEYSMSLSSAMRAMNDFPGVNIISVGGNWNGYTLEAKRYCIESEVGLFNSMEINQALFKTQYWLYER